MRRLAAASTLCWLLAGTSMLAPTALAGDNREGSRYDRSERGWREVDRGDRYHRGRDDDRRDYRDRDDDDDRRGYRGRDGDDDNRRGYRGRDGDDGDDRHGYRGRDEDSDDFRRGYRLGREDQRRERFEGRRERD